jgi:hypothetical protein
VVGGRWVGSHGPVGGGLSLRRSSGPLKCGPGEAEIMRACGSLAW